jgi:hypothetical protein
MALGTWCSVVALTKESDCGNKSYTYFSLEDSTLHSTGSANDFFSRPDYGRPTEKKKKRIRRANVVMEEARAPYTTAPENSSTPTLGRALETRKKKLRRTNTVTREACSRCTRPDRPRALRCGSGHWPYISVKIPIRQGHPTTHPQYVPWPVNTTRSGPGAVSPVYRPPGRSGNYGWRVSDVWNTCAYR